MTLEQLRIFVAVAERSHMTRASEALDIAQSAVSNVIASFEQRHSTKLFHRIGRRISLTRAGEVFLVEARAVLARAEAAELVLAEVSGLKKGRLQVHATQTIASYWLPSRLVRFFNAFPNIDVRLSTGNMSEVVRAVLEGTADFGFVEGAVHEDALLAEPVARDQLIVVVAPNHPWATRDHVDPAQWPESKWVTREKGSGTRLLFEDVARAGGVLEKLDVAFDLPTNEGVRAAVEAGLGASAISASVAAPSIEAGLLTQVASALPERTFTYIRHSKRFRSSAEDALISILKDRGPARKGN